MKKRRIKKIVKSRLHRIKPDGDLEFATTDAKIAALASLNALADGTGTGGDLTTPGDGLLLAQLGITNPGAINETLDIDRDGGVAGVDAFPRDAREVADADGDGIGNNEEIVNLHVLLLAIQADAALDNARVGEATTALTATATELGNLQDHEADPNGDDDFEAYQTALTAFNTAVTTLETLEGNSAAKVAEATEAHAAMSALPEPAAGIKYTVDATEYTAATVYAGRDALLAAIEGLKDAIDAQCGIAGEPARVADQNRTAADLTTSPDAPEEGE